MKNNDNARNVNPSNSVCPGNVLMLKNASHALVSVGALAFKGHIGKPARNVILLLIVTRNIHIRGKTLIITKIPIIEYLTTRANHRMNAGGKALYSWYAQRITKTNPKGIKGSNLKIKEIGKAKPNKTSGIIGIWPNKLFSIVNWETSWKSTSLPG